MFKNRVLERLSNPAQLSQLEKEIALLTKPENASWLEKLKECLKGPDAKKLRKTLKEKEWFPQEWIPS